MRFNLGLFSTVDHLIDTLSLFICDEFVDFSTIASLLADHLFYSIFILFFLRTTDTRHILVHRDPERANRWGKLVGLAQIRTYKHTVATLLYRISGGIT